MFNWYRLFNLDEFLAVSLVSKMITVVVEGLGEKNILITQGNFTSILYEDVFLTIGLNDRNPFRLGERAVYLDENNDVWLGIFDAD